MERIDPFRLVQDLPPEWRTVATELLARLGPRDRPYLTPQERAAIDAVIRLRPYLVRNRWGFRCRRCGAVHQYLTLGCIERPFTGWSETFLADRRGLAGIASAGMRVIELGDIEPISVERARELVGRIRARGFPIEDPPDPQAVEQGLRAVVERG